MTHISQLPDELLETCLQLSTCDDNSSTYKHVVRVCRKWRHLGPLVLRSLFAPGLLDLSSLFAAVAFPRLQVLNISPVGSAGAGHNEQKLVRAVERARAQGRRVDLAALGGARCPALQEMVLSCMPVDDSSLAALVAACPALRVLDISSTEVADIRPLAGLSRSLTSLDVTGLALDVRDLVCFRALQTLALGHSTVVSLDPIAALSALRTLRVATCAATSLDALALGCTSLETLFIEGAHSLTHILRLPPSLRSLHLNHTPVSDISFSDCLDLREFCYDGVTSLRRVPASLPAQSLHTLRLRTNGAIDSVEPLRGYGQLRELELEHTPVHDLTPLATCTNLRFLHLANTQVVDLCPLAALAASLTRLVVRGDFFRIDPLESIDALRHCVCLEELDLSTTSVVDLGALSYLTALHTLLLSQTRVGDLRAIAACARLRTLDLESTLVVDITALACCPLLETLNLRSSPVVDITPLAQCTALKSVNLSESSIKSVAPLGFCTLLESLSFFATAVSEIGALSACTNLQALDCSRTDVNDLTPLATCIKLRTLDIGNTKISSVGPLAACTGLRSLVLQGVMAYDLEDIARPGLNTHQRLVGMDLDSCSGGDSGSGGERNCYDFGSDDGSLYDF